MFPCKTLIKNAGLDSTRLDQVNHSRKGGESIELSLSLSLSLYFPAILHAGGGPNNNNECMNPWRQLVCLQNLGRDIENYIVEIAAVGGKGKEVHNHLLQTQLFKYKDILQ